MSTKSEVYQSSNQPAETCQQTLLNGQPCSAPAMCEADLVVTLANGETRTRTLPLCEHCAMELVDSVLPESGGAS